MSTTISRRTFTAGSVAVLLSGGATFSLPSAAVLAAQTASDFSSLGLPTLDVTASAAAFEGMPESVEAGRYLLTLTAGDDLPEGASVGFVSPPSGTTPDDFLMLLGGGGGTPEAAPAVDASPAASPAAEEGGDEGPLPTIVYQSRFAGGTAADSGGTSQSVIDLSPGDWIMWGDDPSASQAPVVFTVTGEMPADLPEPDADVMVTFIDFAITLDGALTAGDHIARIENQGAQPHFLALFKGPDTMTNEAVAALLDWEMGGMQGTPPDVGFDPDADLLPVAFTATQSIGTVQWVLLSLDPGTYLAACFFPTAGEGLPHAYHGMHTVFTVS